MDSSVLLDNINDILSIWDSHQSNTHSLQPFSPNAGLFSPPSFPSMVPDDPILMTSTANTASSMQPSAHLRPGDNGKRKKYNNKHNKYHPATSPANYHKSRSKHSKNNKEEASKLHRNKSQPSSTASPTLVTMAGPHQTFYIKDDTSIHSNNRSKNTASSASNKSSKHSHSRHRGHHHHNISRTPINITNVEEIPSFIKRNDRRLNLLKEMIELKRLELERISARHDCTLSSIISLYISAGNNIISLRKQHRTLSLFAEQLSREGQIRNKLSDSILNTLHNIEEQRKNLLNVIESPSWEIKHHFHILSFEHFRGNQQPHLLEIAEVLPSRLQIAAISHHSTTLNDTLLKQFNVAQKERDLLYKKLSQIDKKRNLTQAHLKDYKKMMTIIKKNIGEKKLKQKQEQENAAKLQQQQQQQHKQNKQQSQSMSISPPFLGRPGMPMPPGLNPMVLRDARARAAMATLSPTGSPAFGAMRTPDRFRRKYLEGIGISKSKKVEFNLVEFVVQINKFLGISNDETKQELKDLKDSSDLINPLTGQMANDKNKDSKDKDKNKEKEKEKTESKDNKEEADKEKTSEEKKEEKKESEDSNKKANGSSSSLLSSSSSASTSSKSKSKYKNRRRLIERPLKQNILNIIDKDKFVLREEKGTGNAAKIAYSVALKEDEEKEGYHAAKSPEITVKSPRSAHSSTSELKEDGEHDEIDLNIALLDTLDIGNEMLSEKDGSLDAPHRDWSVLAKHLKDSSKEQARRKQILKQLERILHVREGLIVGFDQLQQIYDEQQKSKFPSKNDIE